MDGPLEVGGVRFERDGRVLMGLPAVVTLTDNSGGTASATIAAIGGTYNQAEVRNAVASLAAAINALSARVQ